jgi:hypothetical protein
VRARQTGQREEKDLIKMNALNKKQGSETMSWRREVLVDPLVEQKAETRTNKFPSSVQ